MTVVLVPAGQSIGPMTAGGPCVVRLGAQFHELDPVDYQFWAAAFGAGDVDELRRRTCADDLAEETLTAMLDLGLLATYDPADAARTFARYVLVAQGFGQGRNPKEPDEFVIGGPVLEPVAGVDAVTYAVWTSSCRTSLADTCTLTAERLGLPAREVTSRVATDLPELVAAGAAVLDLADGLEAAR